MHGLFLQSQQNSFLTSQGSCLSFYLIKNRPTQANLPFDYLKSIDFCCCSVTKSCLMLCNPMDCGMTSSSVLHYLLEFVQIISFESVMLSDHLILCPPLLLFPSVICNEQTLCIRWAKYWSFTFSNSPSNEQSGLISIRIYWFDPLAVQGTLKRLELESIQLIRDFN